MHIILSTLSTIFFVRMFVLVATQIPALQFIFHDQSYHFYYGFLLMLIALFARRNRFAYIIFGIGAGLFIDDVGALKYTLFGPSTNPITEYWSSLFLIPLFIGLCILVLGEKRLKNWFLAK